VEWQCGSCMRDQRGESVSNADDLTAPTTQSHAQERRLGHPTPPASRSSDPLSKSASLDPFLAAPLRQEDGDVGRGVGGEV